MTPNQTPAGKFDGLVYTDSMSMLAVTRNVPPDRAAALAVAAGADQVLHSPDDEAAFRGIRAAVMSGEIPEAQITASVRRVLTAMTLIKDDRRQVPLTLSKTASLLYLSVIDYASGWREGAPSRTALPELKQRWPNTTGVEVSDRTSASVACGTFLLLADAQRAA